ncbi:MAG: FABP family protein, partial [Actinomycetota bacterium]|nr:FABP family protein [Actinomycetota bacterium]
GRGEYPTIEPFEYRETVVFGHVGKPFLSYAQRTARDGMPSHAEVGYLRAAGDGRVELVLAHPTGVAEIEEGTVDGACIELRTTGVVRSATAKEVVALERSLAVEADTLSYTLRMAAMGLPLQHHLSATLRRVAG